MFPKDKFQKAFHTPGLGLKVASILDEKISLIPAKDRDILTTNVSHLAPDAISEFRYLLTYDDACKIQPRHVLVFMLMNIVNIVDEQCEKDPILMTNPDKFHQMPISGQYSLENHLESIHNIAMYFDTSDRLLSNLNSIVEWQSFGMLKVLESNTNGQISYSLKDAIDYRLGTLRNYFKSTAAIGIDGKNSRRNFVSALMRRQESDDQGDLWEDLKTQCNPFIAILSQHNLIGLIKNEFDDFDSIATMPTLTTLTKREITEKSEYVHEAYQTF